MKKLILLALIFTMFSACKSELDNKPEATVNEATDKKEETAEKKEEPTEKKEAVELAVNPETSKIDFVGSKVTGDHSGTFKTWEGKAWVEGETLSKVWFEVDTTSLSVYPEEKLPKEYHEKLEGHLKSPDFFDVEKHQKATFTSTAVTAKAAGDFTHEVTGDLEIRGVKKSVTFPAKVEKVDSGVKASTEFKIQRKDFGMEFDGKDPADLIKPEVLLKITLETKAPQKG